MSLEHENFDALRKLMALKRHEIPPPGYFDHLPGRISSRLRANEGMPTFWESLLDPVRRNMAVAYGFGLTACGALALSILYGAKIESARADAEPRDLAVSWNTRDAAALAGESARPALGGLHVANWVGETNPASPSYGLPSLFARPMQPATMPTAYEAAGN